jgi:hypothetical protein
MKQPKEVILRSLKDKLVAAQDELCRARLGRKGSDVNEIYGESGRTVGELCLEAEVEVAEITNAIRWANTL